MKCLTKYNGRWYETHDVTIKEYAPFLLAYPLIALMLASFWSALLAYTVQEWYTVFLVFTLVMGGGAVTLAFVLAPIIAKARREIALRGRALRR